MLLALCDINCCLVVVCNKGLLRTVFTIVLTLLNFISKLGLSSLPASKELCLLMDEVCEKCHSSKGNDIKRARLEVLHCNHSTFSLGQQLFIVLSQGLQMMG